MRGQEDKREERRGGGRGGVRGQEDKREERRRGEGQDREERRGGGRGGREEGPLLLPWFTLTGW